MLPLSIVLILLICSIVILVSRNAKTAKVLTMGALGATFVLSLLLVYLTRDGAYITWSMGAEPWNISLHIGALEAFVSALLTGVCLMAMWASLSMLGHDIEQGRMPLYYSLICALMGLLCGVLFFENLINVFIFIELSSFAAAGIVIIKNEPENIRAGLKYLTLSILGSGLVLMGIVIFYIISGSLAYTGIGAGLAANYDQNESLVLLALVFITLGVAFKSALFPFHIWLPDAHATAPSTSSAVLSSLVLKAFIVFYIKVLYRCVGVTLMQDSRIQLLLNVVLWLGIAGMLLGSVMALLQTDLKRMIAYSSVAQIGYIFVGIGLGNYMGLYAAIFHILAHSIAKSGLFLVAGAIIEGTGTRNIDELGGLGIKMPVTTVLLSVGALSMVGVPLFIGFNSKWNFAVAILDAGDYWVLVALVISTLLNALYYLPVIVKGYFGKEAKALQLARESGENVLCERPLKELLPLAVLAATVIVFAVFSSPFTSLINSGISSIW